MRPDIFQHHDIREFLQEHFAYLKMQDPQFSLRNLAVRAGLSVGILPDIMSRKVTLTAKALEKIVPFLEIPKNEIVFLNWLRELSEGHTHEERAHAYKNIRRHGRYSHAQKKELESYQYLSKWYYPVIREMANWPDFQLEAKWVRARLGGFTFRESRRHRK